MVRGSTDDPLKAVTCKHRKQEQEAIQPFESAALFHGTMAVVHLYIIPTPSSWYLCWAKPVRDLGAEDWRSLKHVPHLTLSSYPSWYSSPGKGGSRGQIRGERVQDVVYVKMLTHHSDVTNVQLQHWRQPNISAKIIQMGLKLLKKF